MTKYRTIAMAFLAAFLSSCVGEDFTPVYFPPTDDTTATTTPSQSTGSLKCTLYFTPKLCVAIKGDNIDVGTKSDDQLCAEVSAFPIHVDGTTVSLKGDEFPDIIAKGHGLPVPITINGRGSGDGTSNKGEGTIDSSGNITIKNFSMYITALGLVGEIPKLTLTTGTTDKLPNLDAITGSPPDAAGAMTLVTGTVLGSVIAAADKYLKGASLTATFTGSISPSLSQCTGTGEQVIEVTKLSVAADGTQTESSIPDDKQMEVSSGTYISKDSSDVGGKFETSTKFKVKNTGTKSQSIQIPPKTGPFYLRSLDPLTQTLASQESLVLTVTFKPTSTDKPGKITQSLSIGPDQFQLVGTALSKAGKVSVNTVDDSGNLKLSDITSVDIGSAQVSVSAEQAFFLCSEIQCSGIKSWTSCSECKDPTTTSCQLLSVSTSGKPIGEVDSSCNAAQAGAVPRYTIDFKDTTTAISQQVLAIRNNGVTSIDISSISLTEADNSQSTGEFSIPDSAIFLAKSFSAIQKEVATALAGKKPLGTSLPVTLPPYSAGWDETTLYVVVIYEPSDALGADGIQASTTKSASDKATMTITTGTGAVKIDITGTTAIATAKTPTADETTGEGKCKLSFTSKLCVVIKGDNVNVGTRSDDQLCVNVSAIPIHIDGATVKIKGNEFPDIAIEGHGLPTPITVNARGSSDGASNVGEGTIDSQGNMTIKNFSLYFTALGMIGEVPKLTLTTGTTENLTHLDAVTGSPPDATGNMALVLGTVLGQTIDAADKYLKGASLTASFTGQISPLFSQCSGVGVENK